MLCCLQGVVFLFLVCVIVLLLGGSRFCLCFDCVVRSSSLCVVFVCVCLVCVVCVGRVLMLFNVCCFTCDYICVVGLFMLWRVVLLSCCV